MKKNAHFVLSVLVLAMLGTSAMGGTIAHSGPIHALDRLPEPNGLFVIGSVLISSAMILRRKQAANKT